MKKISSILKKKNEIDIIFDDGEILHLDIDIFTDYYLYEGKQLTNDEYKEIKKKIELIDAKNYLLRILNKKEYSIKQARTKLKQRKLEEESIDYLIILFKENGYLNDERFKENLIESLENKNYGYQKIKLSLKENQLNEEYCYDEKKEEQKINNLLPYLIKKYSNYSYKKALNSIYSSLLMHGFVDEQIKKGLNSIDEKSFFEKENLKKEFLKLTIYLSKEEIKEKKQKIIAKLLSRGYSYQDVSNLWKEFYE